MVVVSSTISGLAARPYSGETQCGYMRRVKHQCKDLSCPLNFALVMVFAQTIPDALESCRRLWDTEGMMIAMQRFKVHASTFHVENEEIEQGLLDGDPEAWGNFRTLVGEHNFPVLLPNIDALVVARDSPGEIWQANGPPLWLPKDAEVERGQSEHKSWAEAGLESAEDVLWDLLPELEEEQLEGDEDEDEPDGGLVGGL